MPSEVKHYNIKRINFIILGILWMGLFPSIESVDENIKVENSMVRNITEIFSEIKEKIDSIASISEEHSFSTQEIIKTIEGSNNQISNISDSMEAIFKSSSNLQESIKL